MGELHGITNFCKISTPIYITNSTVGQNMRRLTDEIKERIILQIQECQTDEQFRNFHDSQYFTVLRQELINRMAGLDFWQWSVLWAESLHNGDEEATYSNDLRRIWVLFFKKLSRFAQVNKINLDARWEHRVRTMLVHCLPMDKANALYNLKRPWYGEGDEVPIWLINPRNTQSSKIRFLIKYFELFGAHDIAPFLTPVFELPVQII